MQEVGYGCGCGRVTVTRYGRLDVGVLLWLFRKVGVDVGVLLWLDAGSWVWMWVCYCGSLYKYVGVKVHTDVCSVYILLLSTCSFIFQGFVGCVYGFEEESRDLPANLPTGGVNVGECEVSLCQFAQCVNGGSCAEDANDPKGYSCNCTQVGVAIVHVHSSRVAIVHVHR